MNIAEDLPKLGTAARLAANRLRDAGAYQRSEAIRAMAGEIRRARDQILAANAQDMAAATQLLDRLMLDEERVEAMAAAVEQIANLPDPVGAVIDRWTRPNGLDISRVRTPIGVIGMIYESRPNVTADAAAIALRSGNAIILRCGSEALNSCFAIYSAIQRALRYSGLTVPPVLFVPTTDRAAVGMMLDGLGGTIDLIIPRGGKALVERVSREARVPVLGHLEGVCHTYVHASADPQMAIDIVRNAKLRRISVCGATETLLIDAAVAPGLLPQIAGALDGCELRGDEFARSIVPMKEATEADWSTEYLAPILAVKVLGNLEQAVDHIGRYGTGHTEAIVAADTAAAEKFLAEVDSAIVIWNASTQFADGGEFGFGAEIGIATGKLHARGPVGPEQLTSFKYQLRGSGQVRP
ncbi:glutamate-5-semialdehyde dehydrogenase [Sphingomonas ginkgonis]|uniref:Gamma-glutamyl phosphate reductase n=1 Tax=Sphingomonas ginkgonis TaxID=2315330 RepID=A0A3R9YKD6_9SPHN|nr:glutamate-5-semialdehyde dehydrogenase [Sphingomonas ginkgonis]RST29533.1 glutamate-5-semialdehyde dehydrogenase [Sphingomonas ginkgonis]